eukprot:3138628-Prymnesium_polylepis.1
MQRMDHSCAGGWWSHFRPLPGWHQPLSSHHDCPPDEGAGDHPSRSLPAHKGAAREHRPEHALYEGSRRVRGLAAPARATRTAGELQHGAVLHGGAGRHGLRHGGHRGGGAASGRTVGTRCAILLRRNL